MEFAAMKRRDLLELCRQHGLATRGCKDDLAAALAGVLSLQGAVAAAESAVGVVVGKGCLKRLGSSASDGASGASKRVRFALDETSEVKEQRRTSQVILSQVVAKTRGRCKVRKALPSAAVSGRDRRWKSNDGGGSAHESVTGEVGADAPVTHSRMKVVCSHAHSGVETRNNPAEAEEGGEVVGTVTGRKQKRKAQENAEVNANSQAGNSSRITRNLSMSAAAVLLPPDAEEKIQGRKVGDDTDELPAEEQAAGVQDLTSAASPLIPESSNSSRKGDDCIPSVQKPSKVVLSCRTTRLSSVEADVILSTVVGKKRKKTRGRPKAREALPAATLGRRGRQQKSDVCGNSVDHGAFREVCADAPVIQCKIKAVNSCSGGVKSQNNLAEAEEEEVAVEASTYRKQKRKIQESSVDISADAPSGVSYRRMRKSSSPTAAVLLSSVVERMEEVDDRDELGVKELAEANVLATTGLPIIAESRSQRKQEKYVSAELKPGNVEFCDRTMRVHSIAAVVLSPTVIESKVRKAEGGPNGEVSIDLVVPQNDAPITKSLRNRVVQLNNRVVDETHVRKKLEIKRKPSRPATQRNQPLVPSVEEKEPVVVPCEFSQRRQSSRNHPQPDELFRNTNLENNKLRRVPVGARLQLQKQC